MNSDIKPDFEKLKSEFKNKFTYASGYGVTMEPKSFNKVWIWIIDKIASERSAVKRLQEENEQLKEEKKWISVKDRLPDHLDKVLVVFEGTDNILMASYQNILGIEPRFFPFYADGRKPTHLPVTHWQYIPESPKLLKQLES